MKYQVTEQQINELSDKAETKFRHWVGLNEYAHPERFMPGIADMIKFLDEHTPPDPEKSLWERHTRYWGNKKELVDALWEACREILERE